jgi:hypothetical protein
MRIIQNILISLVVVGSIPMGYSIAQESNLGGINKIKYLAFIKGSCKKLIAGGDDWTSYCLSPLRYTLYKTGRVGFAVEMNGGMVSFSGIRDVQPSLSRYTLYLDKILLVWQNPGTTEKTESFSNNTVGSCNVFGNFAKEISTIKCISRDKDGTVIDLEFVTDGTAPEITHSP